ncbi:MAG: hypothetical protein GY784_14050, partial [Gammaproteobacteria bacterium]|nr:hypothetical protein [Gammaproteobacteria bacterium]
EADAKETKKTAKLAGKKAAVRKPTGAKAKSKAKDKTKPRPNKKTKIPSDVEKHSAQIEEPVDIPEEVDIGKSDSEILTENMEAPQTDDQAGDVTEAILDAAAETERVEEDEVEELQTKGEQADIIAETEDSDTKEGLNQVKEEPQTDELKDGVSESVVEDSVESENSTDKIDDTEADKQADDPTEEDTKNSDSEILSEDLEAPQTGDQTGDVTDAILEAAAEAERVEEDEVEELQSEDEQADIIAETEDSDTKEGLSQVKEEPQTDELKDGVSESVVEDSVESENSTEKIDDTEADDPTEADAENSDTEMLTKNLKAPQTDDQAGDVTEAILDAAAETERVEEDEVEELQTEDEQADIIVEAEDSDTEEGLSQEKVETQ